MSNSITTERHMSDAVNTLVDPGMADLEPGGPAAFVVLLSDAQVQEISRGIRMLHEATEKLVEEFRGLGIEFTPPATLTTSSEGAPNRSAMFAFEPNVVWINVAKRTLVL